MWSTVALVMVGGGAAVVVGGMLYHLRYGFPGEPQGTCPHCPTTLPREMWKPLVLDCGEEARICPNCHAQVIVGPGCAC